MRKLAYRVFDAITSPTQGIVFQVQELEAGVDVFDEFADLERAGEVAEGDGVGCKAGLWESAVSGKSLPDTTSEGGRICESSWSGNLESPRGEFRRVNERTNSSMVVIKARRYSSMVR